MVYADVIYSCLKAGLLIPTKIILYLATVYLQCTK